MDSWSDSLHCSGQASSGVARVQEGELLKWAFRYEEALKIMELVDCSA